MTPRPSDSTKNSTETSGASAASLSALLAEHCARLGAEGGAVITVAADGLIGIPAVWPTPTGDDDPPAWLTAALRAAPAAMAATTTA